MRPTAIAAAGRSLFSWHNAEFPFAKNWKVVRFNGKEKLNTA